MKVKFYTQTCKRSDALDFELDASMEALLDGELINDTDSNEVKLSASNNFREVK